VTTKHSATRLHCPHCREVRVCEDLPPSKITGKLGPRRYRAKQPDIQWFERARECSTCGFLFLTAEINKPLMEEFVALREANSRLAARLDLLESSIRAAGAPLRAVRQLLRIPRKPTKPKRGARPPVAEA
jgi:hypothetical protein